MFSPIGNNFVLAIAINSKSSGTRLQARCHPACCIVAQNWIDCDLDRVTIGIVQTYAARFDIGLFERSALEKSVLLLLCRLGSERCDFPWREA
jgi:hypothetical protein